MNFFGFRFWPKQKDFLGFGIGKKEKWLFHPVSDFGRNEKKPFGRALVYVHYSVGLDTKNSRFFSG